jgi:geranylgeranyl reductase family protein
VRIGGTTMFDLIIVGAGPAGSSAARSAAKAGLDVLVLEKEAFPRYKPCGGALSDRAISLLDFPLPEELCERTITGARVHFHNNAIESHKGSLLSTLVTRSKFDNFLLQKAQEAGCNLVTQKVEGYQAKEDHVEVRTKRKKYKSQFFIISSGCQSRLKDDVQGRAARDQCGVSIVTEIGEDDKKIEERLHSSLDFYLDVAETGYGWIFPHKGYYSVGIGGQASRLGNPKRTMLNFLNRLGFQGKCKLHGHMIPMGGFNRRIGEDRILLAGDSAGFVDPFTGEGIYYAIRSGQIAAQTILNQDPAEVAGIYEENCRKDFGEELSYALWIAQNLDERRDAFLNALTENDVILNSYLEISAGREKYRDFTEYLVPWVVQASSRNFNDQVNRVPEFLRSILGTERINLKIILENGNIIRTGFKLENGKIAGAAKGGLRNPTVILTATERAMRRIERSRDPLAALQKERRIGGIAIVGRNTGSQLKLNVLLDILLKSYGTLKFLNRISF